MEFRVKNFKSIRDSQTLSMAATSDKSLEDTHVLQPEGIPQRLLKLAAIYGPNAGGKSNLLQALEFMKMKVVEPSFPYASLEDDEYEVCPFFRLAQNAKNTPSEFEVTYAENGVRYQYSFALLRSRVVEERLSVYKSGKPQEWFHRTADAQTDEDIYKFSAYFKGQKMVWQKSTRKEALFLSVAANLNSEQLRPVHNWFLSLAIKTDSRLPLNEEEISASLKDARIKQDIMAFLSAADVGIADVVLRTTIEKMRIRHKDTKEPQVVERERQRPVFVHRNDEGVGEEFEPQEESRGTWRLFLLAFLLLKILKKGDILVLDELETSLHPALARFVVGLFNSADNKNGAQLIFSTHNAGLLDIKEIFRRDQIWFVEKDKAQATVLYSLTDFNPRKDAAVESGYLTGRYGAIPFLTNFTWNDSYGE
jgi:predicted ATP-dependent endonuclease of OLD family